jgi:hypothetical protein
VLEPGVDHGVAAVLDDHGLAGEVADVGQGLEDDAGLLLGFLDHGRLPSS